MRKQNSQQDIDFFEKGVLTRIANKILNFSLSWLPERPRKIVGRALVIIIALILIYPVYGNKLKSIVRYFNSKPSELVLRGDENREERVKQAIDVNLNSYISSNFTDKENWDGFDFVVHSSNPTIVSVPEGINGLISFYKKDVSSSFAANLNFIPLGSEKTNLVFQYDGLFRLIVGENNFKAISVEQNSEYGSVPGKWVKIGDLEKGATQRFIGGDGFKSNSGVDLKVTTSPLAFNKLHVMVDVSYLPTIDYSGGAPSTARFQYDLITPIDAYSLIGRIGVGIINPSGVKLQLNELIVEKYDLK